MTGGTPQGRPRVTDFPRPRRRMNAQSNTPTGETPIRLARLRRLERRLGEPRVAITLIALLGLLALATWFGSGRLALNGGRAGVALLQRGEGLAFVVRAGWPSKAWIDREHLRGPGTRWASERNFLGFRPVAEDRWWHGPNGKEYHVRSYGVALPWWYLVLLAVSGLLERARRSLTKRPARLLLKPTGPSGEPAR